MADMVKVKAVAPKREQWHGYYAGGVHFPPGMSVREVPAERVHECLEDHLLEVVAIEGVEVPSKADREALKLPPKKWPEWLGSVGGGQQKLATVEDVEKLTAQKKAEGVSFDPPPDLQAAPPVSDAKPADVKPVVDDKHPGKPLKK